MRRALGPLLAFAAACGEPAELRGTTAQAIVGGTPSPPRDDATVLVSVGGEARCTGVVVAPNLILTARHCVTDVNPYDECGAPLGRDLAPALFTVSASADATPRGVAARGKRVFRASASNGVCGADVALLLLDGDLDVAPAKVRFSPPDEDEEGRAVGYAGGARRARDRVRVLARGPVTPWVYRTKEGVPMRYELPENDFATTEATCFGDSGGPLLDAEGRVFGVASRGPDPTCEDRPTVWTSVAAFASLVREAAADAGHPLDEASPRGDAYGSRGEAPPESAGCHASPRAAPGDAPWLLLALLRRRRAPRPSPRAPSAR